MDSENPLLLFDVKRKIEVIETACHNALLGAETYRIPEVIGRDIEVRPVHQLPGKKGMGSQKGQARLLHDLASIELQAMEMSFRSLVEFPEAPMTFREQLVELILDEARHFRMCLEQLQRLQSGWGEWPVHTALWRCLSPQDSLLDRLFIVHRYLEGSGLDAGDKILRRLSDTGEAGTVGVVRVIATEELGHVQFGSRWYRATCEMLKTDPDLDFRQRATDLYHRLPRRLEALNPTLRRSAGFNDGELEVLASIQQRQSKETNLSFA